MLFPCFTEYDDQKYRVRAIHALVHKLPEKNRAMLDILTNHLHKYVHINVTVLLLFNTLKMSLILSYFPKNIFENALLSDFFSRFMEILLGNVGPKL